MVGNNFQKGRGLNRVNWLKWNSFPQICLENRICVEFSFRFIEFEGVEVTDIFKEKGRFKLFKRTEGVSTTDITGKLLAIA